MNIKTTKQIIEESNKAAMEIQRDLGVDAGMVSQCLLAKWVNYDELMKEFPELRGQLR